MPSKLDLKTHKYTRLLVIKENSKRLKNQVTWVCKCDCGNIVNKTTRQLRTENNKSCGCLLKENARKIGFGNRKGKGESGLNNLYIVYRSNAKNKNLPFDIDLNFFYLLTQCPCYYCNKMPSQVFRPNRRTIEGGLYAQYIYNGLDRIDSNKGYVKDNLLPCCKICNYAKRSMSILEFKNWIKTIYNNFIGDVNV